MLIKKMKNGILKNLLITLLCSAVFLFISLPFSKLFPILKLTEIRPAAALYPAFGLVFGVWGALGCAIGNFLLDILQGNYITVYIQSFFIQFAISYLTYVLWYGAYKRNDKKISTPIFNKTSNILKYNILVLICSFFASVMVGSLTQVSGYANLIGNTSVIIFFNHLVFGILFGMPVVTLLTRVTQSPYVPKDKKVKTGNLIFSNFILFIVITVHISLLIYAIYFKSLPKWLFYFYIISIFIFLFTKPLHPANIQKKNQKYIFSLNEKMIFRFTMSGIILALITGLIVYIVLFDTNASTVDLWEKICFAVVVVINLFFVVTTITFSFMERKITIPISKISESVTLYDAKDSKGSIPDIQNNCQSLLNEKNEIGEMATAIANMLNDIESYTETIRKNTAEKERAAAQLEIAAKIQTDLLPHNFSDYENMGISLYADMTPARAVGGDFFDFYSVDDDNIAFVIGDVSGKGIPAALFMAMSKMLIKMYVCSEKALDDAVNKINSYICKNNSMEMFLTAFIGIYNTKNNILTYVNAGHNPPMLLKNGCYSPIKTKPNLILGVFDDAKYTSDAIVLDSKDGLFMYTDGVTEAKNSIGAMFGEERLIKALKNNCIGYSVEKTLKIIKESVNKFSENTPQFDDMTMLCFRLCNKDCLSINADTENLHAVLKFVEQFIMDKPINSKTRNELKIVAEEIFVNICHYAYGNDKGTAEIIVSDADNGITVTFKDSGMPFNPLNQPAPDMTEEIMDMKIGGMGIYLVKQICDNITYEYRDNKNILTIYKSFALRKH